MLTIEGILHLRGSEKDLYSPQYFAQSTSEDHDPVRQLKEMIGGHDVYLYGWETINWSPTAVCIKADLLIPNLSGIPFVYEDRVFKIGDDNWNTDPTWRVDNPHIPPEKGYISNSELAEMPQLRMRYLAERDKTAPVYYSFDQHLHNCTAYADAFNRFKPWDRDLYLAQIYHEFNPSKSLFFVNGLCCYREIVDDATYGEVIKLTRGKSYLRNGTDRKRGIQIVDFNGKCDVSLYQLMYFGKEFPTLAIDVNIDVDNSSFLLVIDGRLYLPHEFKIYNDHTLKFNTKNYTNASIFDRLCCESKFIGSYFAQSRVASTGGGFETQVIDQLVNETRNIEIESVDLKAVPNSFLVVFNRRNLKVIEHNAFSRPPQDGYMSSENNQFQFSAAARGILFDRTTRSVVDYTGETNDMTFYKPGDKKPVKWEERTVYINPETPLEIWGKYNNDMSASATMHDRKDARGSAFVLRPDYCMLDFIFER